MLNYLLQVLPMKLAILEFLQISIRHTNLAAYAVSPTNNLLHDLHAVLLILCVLLIILLLWRLWDLFTRLWELTRVLSVDETHGHLKLRNETTIESINRYLQIQLGYTASELRKTPLEKLITDSDSNFSKHIKTGKGIPKKSRVQLTCKDGKAKWFEFIKIHQHHRRPVCWYEVDCVDEQLRIELETQEDLRIERTITALSNQIFDPPEKLNEFNFSSLLHQFAKETGYHQLYVYRYDPENNDFRLLDSTSSVRGIPVKDIHLRHCLPELHEQMIRGEIIQIPNGNSTPFDTLLQGDDDTSLSKNAATYGFPWFHNHTVSGYLLVQSDKLLEMTKSREQQLQYVAKLLGSLIQQIQTHHRIQESEKRYKLIFDALIIGVSVHEIICDDDQKPIDYRFLEVNPEFEKTTGLKAADIIGKRVLQVIPDLEPIWIEKYGSVALEGKNLHFEHYVESIEKYFEVFAYQNQPGQFVVLSLDTTERKELVRREQETNERIGLALQIASIGCWDWNPQTGALIIDEGWARMLGYEKEDLEQRFGKNERMWESLMNEEDRERVFPQLRNHVSGKTQLLDIDFRLLTNEGNWLWIRSVGKTVECDHNGEAVRMIGVHVSIQEQKQKQQAQMDHQRQLDRSERLATLGTLVAGVAHEINNPNQMIQANVHLIERSLPTIRSILDSYVADNGSFSIAGFDYPVFREKLAQIIDATKTGSRRIKEIVDELRDFAREEAKHELVAVEIHQILTSVLLLTSHEQNKATDHFHVMIPEEPIHVMGDRKRLEQVIINLLLNAFQALESREQKVYVICSLDSTGKKVMICIKDEGIGILPENLSKVKDPFFSTKLAEGGTGLGLSICSSIVESLNGVLTIESVVGQGTEVTVILPVINPNS